MKLGGGVCEFELQPCASNLVKIYSGPYAGPLYTYLLSCKLEMVPGERSLVVFVINRSITYPSQLSFVDRHGDRLRRDTVTNFNARRGLPAVHTSKETRYCRNRIYHRSGSLYVRSTGLIMDAKPNSKLDFVSGTFVPSIPQIAKDLNSTGSAVG